MAVRCWLVAIILALVGCGGGDGGSDADDALPDDDSQQPVDDSLRNISQAPANQCSQAALSAEQFTNFESGQVRPMALSANGDELLVVNTPNNCLEIYALQGDVLSFRAGVSVGLEPVSVAYNGDGQAWVVNHLSDSVSIVDLGEQPRVIQSLQVGDEPRDILFAGSNGNRAFISAARRGQNHPEFNPVELRTAGNGQADIWVFDASNPGSGFGGTPLEIITLFSTPVRALASNADGSEIYAMPFLSGNQSTVVNRFSVLDGATPDKPAPDDNFESISAPSTGLIVQYDGSRWLDDSNQVWDASVDLSLPDNDVFAINTDTLAVRGSQSGVGTVLFNGLVNAETGSLYVTNTEARNRVRFEGPGTIASSVRGHFLENRISVVRNNSVTPIHLNPHINFDIEEGDTISPALKAQSIAQPQQMVLSPDAATLYLAGFGSNSVAVIDVAELEAGRLDADVFPLADGGPAGLLLNSAGDRLVVYSRFAHSVSILNAANLAVMDRVALFNPEPDIVSEGRPFLYDAQLTSATGTTSCGGCHLHGDLDALGWDLGNPDGQLMDKPVNAVQTPATVRPNATPFHPMKGPMTTQTLRGIVDSGPMHWRGDRTGNSRAMVNGRQESREAAAFKAFNPAFVGLLGRSEELQEQDLQAFTDFALTLQLPPNPVRNLDNSLSVSQQRGSNIYFNVRTTGITLFCNDCHLLDREQRLFGTNTTITEEGPSIVENFKVPHLRNMYQKTGMFLSAGGDPVTQGFGFSHDGSRATLADFFDDSVFNFPQPGDVDDLADFLFVFDTNLAPIVGQQVTLVSSPDDAGLNRLALLEQRAELGDCRLQARAYGLLGMREVGGSYLLDSGNSVSRDRLLTLLDESAGALTFTCLPPL